MTDKPKIYNKDDKELRDIGLNFQAYRTVNDIRERCDIVDRALKDNIFSEIARQYYEILCDVEQWLALYESEREE